MSSFLRPLILVSLLLSLPACVTDGKFDWPWKNDKNEAELSVPRPTRWCYKSMANVDCYDKPQPGRSASLVNVDPPERFPASKEAYDHEVAKTE